jgi:hypothetical protein
VDGSLRKPAVRERPVWTAVPPAQPGSVALVVQTGSGPASAAAANADRGRGPRRRELAVLLLAGAAGFGLVLFATRQPIARVLVLPPRPFPATSTAVTWQDLRPASEALALAALASLGAVLAVRGFLRRVTGLVTAAAGALIAWLAAEPVTRAEVIVAAAGNGTSGGPGSGTAAGSATAGNSGQAGGALAGFGAHVLIGGAGWRVLDVVGALVLIVIGILVAARAGRLPAMSARYDRNARVAAGSQAQQAARLGQPGLWDSLSAGADPTVVAEARETSTVPEGSARTADDALRRGGDRR